MLSSSSLDSLLALLSAPDSTFGSLISSLHQRFPPAPATFVSSSATSIDASPSAFQARCACVRLLDGGGGSSDETQSTAATNGDGAEVTLRPHQRLAAFYLLAQHIPPAPAAANEKASPPSLANANPFLPILLYHLDRCEADVLAASSLSNLRVSPSLLERTFLIQLLLPHMMKFITRTLTNESPRSWSESVVTLVPKEPTTMQSALTGSASPLADALKSLRQTALLNRPPVALSSALSLQHLLSSDLVISSSHGKALLGPNGFASLESVMSTAAASSSSSIGSVSLHFTVAPPRYSAPALIDIDWETEAAWMDWNPPPNMNWDVTAASSLRPISPQQENIPQTPLAQLLSKALRSQLLAGERTQLLNELKANASEQSTMLDPSPILQTAIQLIPPSRLSQLVEKNHDIAREFLLQFMTLSLNRASASIAGIVPSSPLHHTINAYLSPLVHMDMSLHSMELVKDLTLIDQIPLPSDFLHLYISKCLASCSSAAMGTSVVNQVKQTRHVRLICVFLHALIRHKIIQLHGHGTGGVNAEQRTRSDSGTSAASQSSSSASASASTSTPSSTSSTLPHPYSLDTSVRPLSDVLLVEVQSFLVEFSRIKEAANLYKFIKLLETEAQ